MIVRLFSSLSFRPVANLMRKPRACELDIPFQALPVFRATAAASEEAIINALVAAETMTGFRDRMVHSLPIDRLLEVMRRYNRLVR
jgi:L-aminopeptidase/D-esterase-like protein